jgi:hypothetical protein
LSIVKLGTHRQAGCCLGGSDEVDDHLMAD